MKDGTQTPAHGARRVKHDPARILDWQQSKYAQIRAKYRPRSIKREGHETLSYDWVEGANPKLWRTVHAAAAVALWDGQAQSLVFQDRLDYVGYVVWQAAEQDLDVRRAMSHLLHENLTPVRMTHGDLTFANVIETAAGVVFIDPGNDHGLCCREIDEASILQSLDGFDVPFRGWDQPRTYPRMRTHRVHWVLLLSHYVRMLRHVTPVAGAFARARVLELRELLL